MQKAGITIVHKLSREHTHTHTYTCLYQMHHISCVHDNHMTI